MQSVLPLEVKTLKHKTADQVPADRRFALFTVLCVYCNERAQERDHNHDALIRCHSVSLPSSVTEAGGNHRQHSSAYAVIIAWSYSERKGELTEGGDGGIIEKLAREQTITVPVSRRNDQRRMNWTL